jgi:hypothetical protein
MTGGLPPDRDTTDIEALVADRYLESVLAAAERGADDAPADAELDPETRRAVGILRRALVRVHPSFRFEERLAGRLAALGDARADAAGVVVAFGSRPADRRVAAVDGDPLLPAILAGAIDPAEDAALDIDGRLLDIDSRLAGARRPLLVGGAITSAALSLVGVAWVAWRATRPETRLAAREASLDALARAAGIAARSIDRSFERFAGSVEVGPPSGDVDVLPGRLGGLS